MSKITDRENDEDVTQHIENRQNKYHKQIN